jgi:hypothetical protein
MSFTHRLVLHGTALALSVLLLSAEAPAQAQKPAPEKEQDRTVGSGAGSPQSTPSPAPIGHRQPKASDLPSVVPKDPSDEWLTRINRELDRKIQICRGC